MRKSKQVVASCIDGVSENIPQHFGSLYKNLYNSADDEAKLAKVFEETNSVIDSSQLTAVKK